MNWLNNSVVTWYLIVRSSSIAASRVAGVFSLVEQVDPWIVMTTSVVRTHPWPVVVVIYLPWKYQLRASCPWELGLRFCRYIILRKLNDKKLTYNKLESVIVRRLTTRLLQPASSVTWTPTAQFLLHFSLTFIYCIIWKSLVFQ